MQRITKREVLTDLPNKIREVVYFDESHLPKEAQELNEAFMIHFEPSEVDRPEGLEKYSMVRHENGLIKVYPASCFIANLLFNSPEESLLVFAHHRNVIDLLAMDLKKFNPEIIKGGVSASERTRIEDEFQSGKCRLIMGNLDAVSLGLTLTKATRVIFVEYSWTPAVNEQAEDRAHRIGQKDSVLVQYLVLQNTIDELILDAVLQKQKTIEAVFNEK